MRKIRSLSLWLQLLPFLLISSSILSACADNIATLQEQLPLPTAVYSKVVWLDEETLVFKHRRPRTPADEGVTDRFDDYQISLYRLDTQELREVRLPTPPDDCAQKAGNVGRLYSVPGNRFGYVYPCSKGHRGLISSILYLWDREQNLMVEYATYPKPFRDFPRSFRAGRFSFAPDMSSLILEQASDFSPKLYLVDADADMTRLFPEFERASEPSRSPDGQTIAFRGTERYPFNTDDPRKWNQIERTFYHPYDLFFMDADGSNARIALSQFGTLFNLTWSPDGAHLFFSGPRPRGRNGLWMLHVDTLQVTRIWHYDASFDLSPDGRRIVIIVIDERGFDVTPTRPTIFALPDAS